jgi:hypothetical protein
MRILINTEVSRVETRAPDPGDKWDAGDTQGQVDNVTATLTNMPEGDNYDSLVRELPVSPGEKVWAVVVDYESGSTFGRDGGYAQVLDVFTEEWKAHALRQAALNVDKGFTLEHDGKSYHVSWRGYFETLQSIDVWELTVDQRRGERK